MTCERACWVAGEIVRQSRSQPRRTCGVVRRLKAGPTQDEVRRTPLQDTFFRGYLIRGTVINDANLSLRHAKLNASLMTIFIAATASQWERAWRFQANERIWWSLKASQRAPERGVGVARLLDV